MNHSLAWQMNPTGFVMLAAAFFAVILAVLLWKHRRVPGGVWFFLVMAAIAEWSFCDGLSDILTDPAVGYFLGKFSYLSISSLGALWFLFALRYQKKEGWLQGGRVALLFIIPAIIAISAFSNDFHHLLWTSVLPEGPEGARTLKYNFGPLVWVNVAYSYSLILAGTVLLLRMVFRSGFLYRGQAVAVAIGALIPFIGNVLYVFGLTPADWDPTPAAFTITGAIFALAIFRFGFLDIVPVAYEALFNSMPDGVLVIDRRGRILGANPTACRILGLNAQSVGFPLSKSLIGSSAPVAEAIAKGESQGEALIVAGEKSITYDIRVSPLLEGGKNRGSLVVLRDISERKRMEEELTHFASHDSLTGAFNRRLGLAVLERKLQLNKRNKTALAVCFVDINDLKLVNDRLGHHEGDRMIRLVCRALQESARESDTVCRIGGDEFLTILPQCSETDAMIYWRRAEMKLLQLAGTEKLDFPLKAACGIAVADGTEVRTPDELIAQADAAMYRTKTVMKG